MALKVTGFKRLWLEVVAWDDDLLMEWTEFLVRETPSQKPLRDLGPVDNDTGIFCRLQVHVTFPFTF